MDDQEQEEILYRLDERTKRVDDHLNRLDRRVAENEREIEDHDERISQNEDSVNTARKAVGGLGAALTAGAGGTIAKLAGLIKL